MYTLGIDIGSSSIKVSLLDVCSGESHASATLPDKEMPIKAVRTGWAEQSPEMWWEYVSEGTRKVLAGIEPSQVKAIGITYQMHGLVCLDKHGKPLRDAIIWCDSRAVELGNKAMREIGSSFCLERLLNSPGNFTASKLAWVKEYESEVFAKVAHFMLPGDYIVYRLSGKISTTTSGLSEQILWDFKRDVRADFVADHFGIRRGTIPEALPSIGVQAYVDSDAARKLGLAEGTPISYRAGDQPNNAFSLNVLSAGEIAATGGTSGVVYGVFDKPACDPLSRVNTFLHVNHSKKSPGYGMLLCINGSGILNAWMKRTVAPDLSYGQINDLCDEVPVGSEGVIILPFGNGAERMLENKFTGAAILNLDLNRHNRAHLLRAAQEGIAFSFRYGIDIMRENGLDPKIIRAGHANLFLSPVFRSTLATLCNIGIELYNTDGSLGAARGAALGAGLYKDREEAFATLRRIASVSPDARVRDMLEIRYNEWKKELGERLK